MPGIAFLTAAVFAAALALAGLAAPAHAVSVGFYGTYGIGSASGDDAGDWGGGGWGWDGDSTHAGAGIALETPTGLYRFSYRLGVGWERIDVDGDGGADGTLEGLVIDNDFTYDLTASPTSRFWVGPELRLGFFNGSIDNASGGDRSFVAVGLGPVLGFDLALGPSAALSCKLGYLYSWYYADEDSWGDDYHQHYDGDGYYYDYNYDTAMEEGHVYLSMAVLFRLGGGPRAEPPPGTYQPQGRW